jgi:hypothetical protein
MTLALNLYELNRSTPQRPKQTVILSHFVIIYDDVSVLKQTPFLNLPIHREESFSIGLEALASWRSMAGDISRCVFSGNHQEVINVAINARSRKAR